MSLHKFVGRLQLIVMCATTVASMGTGSENVKSLIPTSSITAKHIGATTTGTGGDKSPPQLLGWGTSNVLVPLNFLVERSFSSVRRLKTYLHNSRSQQRLHHLAVLHVHRDRLYSIDIDVIARELLFKSVFNPNPTSWGHF